MNWTSLRFLAFLLPLLALLGTPAKAAPVSFGVLPMNSEIPVAAGESHTGTFNIKNEAPANSEPLRLRAYIMDWKLDRDGTPQFSKPGAEATSCASWIKLNPVELAVPAGQEVPVRYTVTVPQGVQGAFRCIVMFEAVPEPNQIGPRTVGINGRIGSVLYVQVGPLAKRARITRFAVTPENATLTVANTGTSHVRLRGTLKFEDASGKLVRQEPLPNAVVLPGADGIRDLSVKLSPLPPGEYTVSVLLDFGGEALVGARTHVQVP